MVSLLKNNEAYINSIYSCPHHPKAKLEKFRIKCACRKPETLMFEQALLRYKNPKMLGIIGDQTVDIVVGMKLKIKTVIVKTGYMGQDGRFDVEPDYICDNFLDAVRILI